MRVFVEPKYPVIKDDTVIPKQWKRNQFPGEGGWDLPRRKRIPTKRFICMETTKTHNKGRRVSLSSHLDFSLPSSQDHFGNCLLHSHPGFTPKPINQPLSYWKKHYPFFVQNTNQPRQREKTESVMIADFANKFGSRPLFVFPWATWLILEESRLLLSK